MRLLLSVRFVGLVPCANCFDSYCYDFFFWLPLIRIRFVFFSLRLHSRFFSTPFVAWRFGNLLKNLSKLVIVFLLLLFCVTETIPCGSSFFFFFFVVLVCQLYFCYIKIVLYIFHYRDMQPNFCM